MRSDFLFPERLLREATRHITLIALFLRYRLQVLALACQ